MSLVRPRAPVVRFTDDAGLMRTLGVRSRRFQFDKLPSGKIEKIRLDNLRDSCVDLRASLEPTLDIVWPEAFAQDRKKAILFRNYFYTNARKMCTTPMYTLEKTWVKYPTAQPEELLDEMLKNVEIIPFPCGEDGCVTPGERATVRYKISFPDDEQDRDLVLNSLLRLAVHRLTALMFSLTFSIAITKVEKIMSLREIRDGYGYDRKINFQFDYDNPAGWSIIVTTNNYKGEFHLERVWVDLFNVRYKGDNLPKLIPKTTYDSQSDTYRLKKKYTGQMVGVMLSDLSGR